MKSKVDLQNYKIILVVSNVVTRTLFKLFLRFGLLVFNIHWANMTNIKLTFSMFFQVLDYFKLSQLFSTQHPQALCNCGSYW